LLEFDWDVVAAHRGQCAMQSDLLERGLRSVIFDRDKSDAVVNAIGDGVDAVIDAVAYTAAHAEQLLACSRRVGAMVVISSSSVYRDLAGRSLDEADRKGFPELPRPIPETQPTVAAGPETYSTRKIAMEQALLSRSTCPVTILRPGAIHGPGSTNPREWWFVKRLLDGRSLVPVRCPNGRFHTSSVQNLAELARVTLEHPATRLLNAGDPNPPTVADIADAIAVALGGHRWRIVEVPEDDQAEVGNTPWSVPRPFVLDMAAATAIGYEAGVSYAQAVRETCDWLVANVHSGAWRARFANNFDYAAEDAWLGTINA
jgi:nucleoside-diphosphate-sugar epimerase